MEKIRFIVVRIDGDYAYLKNEDDPTAAFRCVARAILPDGINEGTRLLYELFEYKIVPF